ncbi:MAG TPA: hypothetical protein VGB50_06265 [Flavobacterium sp.]|jgi:hypothetical protein
MSYPLIYSLSTVGIVKHYNQDYLFHPERTDFTGNNGVGKSILADLIQLIFISDDNLIEFGTDSMDKDGRSAYTLPKGISEAYAFMNIEIKQGFFIAIGVCIPNKKSKRLKPFVILKDPDLDKHIDELSFGPLQLPRHDSFIHEGEFFSLENLARHFRDRHSLYLQYFATTEDKNRYYSFLYKKEILSINLSIRSNLKSFAKIIQSFSRAKSLNIKNSQNLKDFLFEETEKDYRETFAAHKSELEKQLFDYKSLETEISQLELKQQLLVSAKKMENIANSAHLAYLSYKLRFEQINIAALQKKCNDGQQKVSEFQTECKKLEKRIPRLEVVLKRMQSDEKAIKQMIEAHRKFGVLQQEIDKLTNEYQRLSASQPPDVGAIDSSGVKIEDFQTEELLKRIEEFKGIFKQYDSLSAMSQKVNEQKKLIQQRRLSLEMLNKGNTEVLALINLNRKDSLFSKVLERNRPLSEMQEAALFELLSTAWGKPVNITEHSTFTENLDLLSEQNFSDDPDAEGYWITLGHLQKYIPKLKQSRLFTDVSKLSEGFAKRQAEIEAVMNAYNLEIAELDKFDKGLPFDRSLILLEYDFDPRLKDYTAYQHFEKTAKLISVLSSRFESIAGQKKVFFEQQIGIEFPYTATPGKGIEYYNAVAEQKRESITHCTSTIAKEKDRISTIKNELITVKESANDADQKNLEIVAEKYRQTLSDFLKLYSEEQLLASEHLNVSGPNLTDRFAETYSLARQNYISEYKMITSKFDETSKGNIEITEQIRDNKFSFHILEIALLGPKIRYTDNIVDNVRELNRVRLGIVDTIFETMLKIFVQTKDKYDTYKTTVRDLNTFFKGTKISKKHYFQIHFVPQREFSIDWIYQLQNSSTSAYKVGELAFSDVSVENFIEEFFKSASGYRRKINFGELLDPKTYFGLEAKLENEAGDKETPGSTGETYAAVVLLGIGRLSKVQTESRKGIKFIILEETANLDATNFSTFPELAKEHDYQIITMTPKPYGSDAPGSWFLHHLIPGIEDTDINFPVSNSYFKTNTKAIPLDQHITTTPHELDSP